MVSKERGKRLKILHEVKETAQNKKQVAGSSWGVVGLLFARCETCLVRGERVARPHGAMGCVGDVAAKSRKL